jgi:hypothetical protein
MAFKYNPITNQLDITGTSGGGGGSVTSVSVVTANGFSGTVANPTTTPAITINSTATSVPTANTIAEWDSHVNMSANSFIEGYITFPTAGTLSIISANSPQQIYLTGTLTQTVKMPVTSTLVDGQSFTIVNNSTGVVTVQSSGGNTIQVMAGSTQLVLTVVNTGVTTAAGWSTSYTGASGGGSVTFTGDTGTPFSGSAVTIYANNTSNACGSTVLFNASTPNITLQVTDSNGNTIIGKGAGPTTATSNNTIFGGQAGPSIGGLDFGHCLFGYQAGLALQGAQQPNTLIGLAAANELVTGQNVIAIGSASGGSYTSSESNNICIGSQGAMGESGILRIGDPGGFSYSQLTTCYIGGIAQSTPSSPSGGFLPVSVDGNTGLLTSGYNTVSSNNTILGNSSYNPTATGTFNTICGAQSGGSMTADASTCIFGAGSATFLSGGSSNCIIGTQSALSMTTDMDCIIIGTNAALSLSGTQQNIIIGNGAANSLTSGVQNLIFGYAAGGSYTGSESGNLLINSAGILGESLAIHIGDLTTSPAATCFIGGIHGVTVTGTAVLCSTSGQLGTIASSRKYKENIVDIHDSILNLRPVKFNYISDKDKAPVYGLIAEEVAESFPDLVFYKNGEIDSVKYHEMPALLLAEIKKLNARIAALEAKTA